MIHRHENGFPLFARDTLFLGENSDFLKIAGQKTTIAVK
jgi:hypothetical protein